MKHKKSPTDKDFTSRISRRALLLGSGQLGLAGVLGWRMHQLGVKQADQFRLLAEENRVNIRLQPPARGLIYDRSGNPLTLNRQVYTIEIVREQADDPEEVLRRLAQLIPLPDSQIQNVLAEMARRRAFVPVTVATGLEWEHIAAVSANSPVLPGITPQLGLNRQYPRGADFSHVVGYVGPVSDYDLSQTNDKDPLLLIPRFQIGKNGIEAKIEQTLRGKAGLKRIEVNSVGRVMRELDAQASTPGTNVQLTVDAELQRFALEKLQGQSAAAVVMDVNNGDILALASAPTFDPNKFVDGISVPDWNALNGNKYRPLANKTVQGTYPPGSTFKMVVGLAGLHFGLINERERVYCPGHMEISGRRFHCWRRGGHGNVNLREALRGSCDVYFYELALRIGIERISQVARTLGVGIRPDIPLPAVREGLAPTKDWKKRVKQEDWLIGDTANSGIGQGFVLASPIQLAIMTARLASGTQIEPRLVNMFDDKLEPVRGAEKLEFDPRHLDMVRAGMYDVTNHTRGTAYRSRLKDTVMAGKTGTTQVRAISKREREQGIIKNKDRKWEWRDHALFVGYAPFDNPRYSVAVIVEHGGGGSAAAAPIAKLVMEKAIELGQSGYGPLPSQKRNDLRLREEPT
ncbi:peptidoglycan glycosyltransferase [Amylibacter marinus]|uniref:Peptidoglycan glycosyltransferase n=1 Tax=Amylibacter marinus TaxID=1475483 RepID=A0ABQ5VYT9_9RHOB|nr:penicillin-binding protein 2 [Amylibacter marinus]GLQ36251.1 peptidoglycan glycosyltransferase [Amylibacter marinus]